MANYAYQQTVNNTITTQNALNGQDASFGNGI